jgi:hypothetical protein
VLAVACGYRPARPTFAEVTVAAVVSEAPEPEVAACLTEELRLGLAARGVRVVRGADLRLEAEVMSADIEPGPAAFRREPVAVEQVSTLVVRVRLVRAGHGVVWGPSNVRVETRAALGPGARHSAAAGREGLLRACRDAAARVIDDLAFAELPH